MHSAETYELCCRLQQLRWRRRGLPLIHSLQSVSLHMPAHLRHHPPPLRHHLPPLRQHLPCLRHHLPPQRHHLPLFRATAHSFLPAHMPFPSFSPTSRKQRQLDIMQIALRQMCLLLHSLSCHQKSLKLLLLPRGRPMNQPAVM